MVIDRLPSGLVPAGGSPLFTTDTIPDALQREHMLAAGHWGVLHVFEGTLLFVNLETAEERTIIAPDLLVIRPQVPHRVTVSGPVRCRIDFFREPEAGGTKRAPEAFADEAVRRSFERCEANGNFAEEFYNRFLSAPADIKPYFEATNFDRQHSVLRDSVYMMITSDVADPAMRTVLDRLGEAHGREGRNIPPRLYEIWLDALCETAKALDPQWDYDLERKWRGRLRAGMQIVMASY